MGDNNFILPRLQGGLGNQLFQIAACFAIQKQTSVSAPKIFIPSCSINPHKNSKIDYATLFLKLPNTHRIELPVEILKSWETFYVTAINAGIPFLSQHGTPFSIWEPSSFNAPCFLEGYFQFWPSLQGIWREFVGLILTGLPEPPHTSNLNNVFIHVRRGDYLQLSDYHYLQDVSYYKNALQHFPDNTNYLIFSDDIEFCKSCGFFDTIINKTFIDEPDEIEALAIMAKRCHGGAICANSTFSYWGAILGPYYHGGKNTRVIVPSRWCKETTEFLFPEGWLIL
jgi:hypothetical protein